MTAVTQNEQGMLFAGMEERSRARRTPPAQLTSETSRAGARHISRRRDTLKALIVAVMHEVGAAGLTIEEMAPLVSRARGVETKETTICGRIAGERSELAGLIVKSGRTRRNASGVEADVYVHVGYRERRF